MPRAGTSATTRVAHAEPTKDFFITMLVRDIDLVPAVIDLIDNSVDGARRVRPNADYEGLSVRLEFNATHFSITDNCGGIPIDIAESYAFRFGRPAQMEETRHSVGQFGVGMKRALFKLGSHISITSHTEEDAFAIDVDVEQWRRTHEWTFEMLPFSPPDGAEPGTSIHVTRLHEGVGSEFGYATFAAELASSIRRVHESSLAAGLAITLNGVPLDVDLKTLFEFGELAPAYEAREYFVENPPVVTLQLHVGISKSSPAEAGWYIYCNGRLVLGPDQTMTTGWGEGNGHTVPKYHNQYARFRGFAFFDCDSATRLPWTTTKTGVDAGHPLYRSARQVMVRMMRPVITFLNALDAEKDAPSKDARPLEELVSQAEDNAKPLSSFTVPRPFLAPLRQPTVRAPDTQSIQYVRPTEQIEAAKKKLRVRSAKQVGERTFDYFYRRECE